MKQSQIIEAVIYDFQPNELILASNLFNNKLDGTVCEATYYKTLERMSKAGKLNKAAKQQQRQQAAGAAKPQAAKASQPKQQKQPAPAPEPFVRDTVLRPSITVTEHDDSVYQGSMNAETGEGYDPCHDEQLAPLSAAETAIPAVETAEPGLRLSWNGSEVVRGFVMSEILKRKH